MIEKKLRSLPMSDVRLLPGILAERTETNRRYLMSLQSENLLQNHLMEAMLWNPSGKPEACHWGWESPTCQVRGHFLGHWLSAAAKLVKSAGDIELKAKAEAIVARLGACQAENGGEWVFSIPEKYLHRIAAGKGGWAVLYVVHKTFMGLLDMYEYAGSDLALEIAERAAGWFSDWSKDFTREQLDMILDVEAGGIMDVFAVLYNITKKPEHLELVRRFERRNLFDRLIAGNDVLTKMHANTTIPEIMGACKAYEATGERRYMDAALAYWRCAVTNRGYFCTGGQTSEEMWCPPGDMSASLGIRTQEFCTVYNMMRLAEWLFLYTGDAQYADYIERNIYNGVLAQQHPAAGVPDYYLQLVPGAVKLWGTAAETFWCCHGTIVQAHSVNNSFIYYAGESGLSVCQYFPSQAWFDFGGARIGITMHTDNFTYNPMSRSGYVPGDNFKTTDKVANITLNCSVPAQFTLKLRVPEWTDGGPVLLVNGEAQKIDCEKPGFAEIRRIWQSDALEIRLPKKLRLEPLPGNPDLAAFMDGPVVLAGLCEGERAIFGDASDPSSILRPYDECAPYGRMFRHYHTKAQPENFDFVPLCDIVDQKYTVYFPFRA